MAAPRITHSSNWCPYNLSIGAGHAEASLVGTASRLIKQSASSLWLENAAGSESLARSCSSEELRIASFSRAENRDLHVCGMPLSEERAALESKEYSWCCEHCEPDYFATAGCGRLMRTSLQACEGKAAVEEGGQLRRGARFPREPCALKACWRFSLFVTSHPTKHACEAAGERLPDRGCTLSVAIDDATLGPFCRSAWCQAYGLV